MDSTLNDECIRLWQIESAMVHLRQNAAALGYGANIAGESLRAERDDILADIRGRGDKLVEGSIATAQKSAA
jgi:hypothetical protein